VQSARTQLKAAGNAVLETQTLELSELHALIARAALFIGGDSGPLHIAATTPVPIVELLGPTLAERSRPWRDPRWLSEVVEPGPLPCRPCHQRTCIPGDFRCLTSIGPDRVIDAAGRALRWTARPGGHVAPDANERRIPVGQR
jgi:heptosyltransferase-1